jgi:hypothetical protein
MYKGSMAVIGCDAPKCPAEVLIRLPYDPDPKVVVSAAKVVQALTTGLLENGWDMEGDHHLCHLHKPGGSLRPSSRPHLVKAR